MSDLGWARSRSSSSSSCSNSRSASIMLYNGKSNRSRGWKSKKLGDMGPTAEGRPLCWPSIKRFDGAARESSGWNHLQKDPELWYRNGNCYVHLYAKGESQKGPAFRVPFACLLDAHCQPLVERFVDRSISETEAFQKGRVDLYIPAPWTANQLQAFHYHLAIRNLFAWVFRRSMVGEHLGTALIALASSLEKFRQPGVDNMQDLLAYLDEEGYLDVRDQPIYALAILRLAENFKLRDLYLESFAHCVGMSERLFKHAEYSRISLASRKLIRHARVDMDFRLSRAGTMLSDLLKEELSEAHLGLSAAARAHLDQFRAYIHGFYTTRFGSFPPGPSDKKCSTIFKPKVYRIMQADFAALYEYLVDHNFTADRSSSMAQGGLCTLQTVHEFDYRHKFVPLPHPLPLLPEPVQAHYPHRRRSLSWIVGRSDFRGPRGRPGQRLLSYAALMRATNHSIPHVLENRLVIAYRQFEEDSLLMTHKAELPERLGVTPADARKVRWLLIYAIYQTLISCAETPSEVNSQTELGYHLGISTCTTLPWDTDEDVVTVPDIESCGPGKPPQTAPPERNRTVSPIPLMSPTLSPTKRERPSCGLDIKPDIDYFALTHPKAAMPSTGCRDNQPLDNSGVLLRTTTLTKKKFIRRSFSAFRHSSAQESGISWSKSLGRAVSLGRKSTHHEIIVHGYGNGTHDVLNTSVNAAVSRVIQAQPQSPRLSVKTNHTTNRSLSTRSSSSYRSAVSRSSAVPSDASSTPTSPLSSAWKRPGQSETNESIADASTLYEQSLNGKPSYTDLKYVNFTVPTRSSSLRKAVRSMYSSDDMLKASWMTEPPPLPRKSSKRRMNGKPNKRWSMVEVSAALRTDDLSDSGSDYGTDDGAVMLPSPLRIQKVPILLEELPMTISPVAMEAGESSQDEPPTPDDWEKRACSGEVASPPCTWEQFTDLGGLQPCAC